MFHHLNNMLNAYTALLAAQATLIEATKVAMPLGKRVRYRYRRMNDYHYIDGEITAFGAAGGMHGPGEVCLKNIGTGKERWVHAPLAFSHGDLEVQP